MRVAAVGGCWYLAATTVVGAALRLLRADVLVAVADRLTIAPVRRLLAGSMTLTLAGIGPTGMLAVAAQPAPSDHVRHPSRPTTSTPVRAARHHHHAAPATAGCGARCAAASRRAPGRPSQWTVAPGECFWTIAADVLETAWGRPPTDAEIVPYWQRLIEANRSELADPGNADLIFPSPGLHRPGPARQPDLG